MRGGWVGSDVWDKVPKKTCFFYTFPNQLLTRQGNDQIGSDKYTNHKTITWNNNKDMNHNT